MFFLLTLACLSSAARLFWGCHLMFRRIRLFYYPIHIHTNITIEVSTEKGLTLEQKAWERERPKISARHRCDKIAHHRFGRLDLYYTWWCSACLWFTTNIYTYTWCVLSTNMCVLLRTSFDRTGICLNLFADTSAFNQYVLKCDCDTHHIDMFV